MLLPLFPEIVGVEAANPNLLQRPRPDAPELQPLGVKAAAAS
jgi:hypothetical protein